MRGGIKDRIVVRYIDERGEEEKGIDLGGLFKDFLTDLSRIVFDPNKGLFDITSGGAGLLYPHSNACVLYGYETEGLFRFVGQILGKALYEDITIQVR
jgi:HECT-domain (ubiquitin-transferase)